MQIERVDPKPMPPNFRLTFSQNDGWGIVAALREYAERHPNAVENEKWLQWAKDLDRELRK